MPKKKEHAHVCYWCGFQHHKRGISFLGIFLVLIGALMYARDAGLIPNISLFPLFLIAIGLWMILSKLV